MIYYVDRKKIEAVFNSPRKVGYNSFAFVSADLIASVLSRVAKISRIVLTHTYTRGKIVWSISLSKFNFLSCLDPREHVRYDAESPNADRSRNKIIRTAVV